MAHGVEPAIAGAVRLFTAMMAAQFLIVLFVFPETKGVTLEAMQKKLGIH